jgi:RNA polymerase sigma-70 factor, ECF subfamily
MRMLHMQSSPLSDAFAAGLNDGVANDMPDLEAVLLEYVTAARSRWPGFGIEDADLVRYMAARVRDGRPAPVAHAADLLLGCACGRGIPAAVEAFLREYGPAVDRVLAHRNTPRDVADDARQTLQQHLLVGDPEKGFPGKIADYRGAGPLRSWVATVAANTLLALWRAAGRRREQPAETAGASLEGVPLDPELEYLRERYATEVEDAIVHALGQMSDRDRTLLRLHLGERLSIDAIGSIYSINRATAARWLVAARSSLMVAARDRLRAQLRISDSECDSLVALVNSRLHVSIVRRISEA